MKKRLIKKHRDDWDRLTIEMYSDLCTNDKGKITLCCKSHLHNRISPFSYKHGIATWYLGKPSIYCRLMHLNKIWYLDKDTFVLIHIAE